MEKFQKSEFTELKDIETAPEPTNSNLPNTNPRLDTQLDVPDDYVPPEEQWSWNPIDWYIGIRREIETFSLQITERKRIMYRAMAGEGLVTFLFLFVVMAMTVNNDRKNSPQNLVLGALGTAFCAVALIYSFADVSGAHFNPAVTFATIITGKTSVRKGILYIAIQMVASVFATLALMAVYPGVGNEGVWGIPKFVSVTVDESAKLVNAFFMEVILTFILVYVIFATAFDTVDTKAVKVHADGSETTGQQMTIYTTSGNTKAGFAPLAIGFTLGFLGLIGGSVSGGAFNPARAFGPTLVSGVGWDNHWLYWVADFIGAGLAGYAQSCFAHEAVQNIASIKTNKATPT